MRWATWIVGSLLIVFGVVVLVFGRLPLGERERTMDAGPLEVRYEEERSEEVPAWAGVLALLAGAGVIVVGARSR